MESNDACYTCCHSYYETDEQVYCPECVVLADGEMSNYEEISDEDIELLVTELNINIVDPAKVSSDSNQKLIREFIKDLVSEPVA